MTWRMFCVVAAWFIVAGDVDTGAGSGSEESTRG